MHKTRSLCSRKVGCVIPLRSLCSLFPVLPPSLSPHARVVSSSQSERHGAETEDLDMF